MPWVGDDLSGIHWEDNAPPRPLGDWYSSPGVFKDVGGWTSPNEDPISGGAWRSYWGETDNNVIAPDSPLDWQQLNAALLGAGVTPGSPTYMLPGQDAGYELTYGDTPEGGKLVGAHYYPNYSASLAAADNGGFMADYGWLAPLAIVGGGMALGAMGGAAPTASAELAGPAMESGFFSPSQLTPAAETSAMGSWAAEDPTAWNQLTSAVDNVTNNPAVQTARKGYNAISAARSLGNMLNPPALPQTVTGLQRQPVQQQQQAWNPAFGNPLSRSIRGA